LTLKNQAITPAAIKTLKEPPVDAVVFDPTHNFLYRRGAPARMKPNVVVDVGNGFAMCFLVVCDCHALNSTLAASAGMAGGGKPDQIPPIRELY
jgi:hypothetical protein